MNASKENARQALKNIHQVARLLDLAVKDRDSRNELKSPLLLVEQFLEAAERKLPTEAAFTKEKNRR